MAYATDTISPSPAINLDTRRNEIHNEHDKAIESLIRVGQLLTDTQEQLADDTSFVRFCDTLKFSRATAYNYMRLYAHSLVQRLDTLKNSLINLSVWYFVPPEDSDTVKQITDRASSGKKVTKELAKQLVSETAPLNDTLMEAAETAPDYVADSIMRGVVIDLDGNEIPITESDSTLIKVTADEHLYEKSLRQKVHIEENSPTKQKLTVPLHLIRDSDGRMRLALPETVPAWLAGKEITFYYETEKATVAA